MKLDLTLTVQNTWFKLKSLKLIILHLFTFVTVGQNLLVPCMHHKKGLWKLLMVIMVTW